MIFNIATIISHKSLRK